jgi:SlyX protein
MNNDIIDLQIRLAHQENHIQELDKVIYNQQQQIDSVINKISLLEKNLKVVTESNILGSAEDKPPPHY